MSTKPGRNDPCFCGSGKKFKKCCYGKDVQPKNHPGKFDILPARQDVDFGIPQLNERFFEDNRLHEISAARMIHMRLTAPKALEKHVRVLSVLKPPGMSQRRRKSIVSQVPTN